MEEFSTIASNSIVSPLANIEHPVHISPRSEIHANSSLGRFSFLNFESVVFSNVSLGRYCSIGRCCQIGVAKHPLNFLSTHSFQYDPSWFESMPEYRVLADSEWQAHPKSFIGHDVWIGTGSIIMSGVRVGTGAVVAANATVVKDVPPYAVVGGSPAGLIKYRFDAPIVERLLSSKWWELDLAELGLLPFDDVETCLDLLESSAGFK